eukprot:m.75663 g.75663  ORF g.75663 m.75663 type:complete len:700 (+) comp7829_c0_seq1:175-2274(+)
MGQDASRAQALAHLLDSVSIAPDIGKCRNDPELTLTEWTKMIYGSPPEYKLGAFDPSIMIFPVEIIVKGLSLGRGVSKDFNNARKAASARVIANVFMIFGWIIWQRALELEGMGNSTEEVPLLCHLLPSLAEASAPPITCVAPPSTSDSASQTSRPPTPPPAPAPAPAPVPPLSAPPPASSFVSLAPATHTAESLDPLRNFRPAPAQPPAAVPAPVSDASGMSSGSGDLERERPLSAQARVFNVTDQLRQTTLSTPSGLSSSAPLTLAPSTTPTPSIMHAQHEDIPPPTWPASVPADHTLPSQQQQLPTQHHQQLPAQHQPQHQPQHPPPQFHPQQPTSEVNQPPPYYQPNPYYPAYYPPPPPSSYPPGPYNPPPSFVQQGPYGQTQPPYAAPPALPPDMSLMDFLRLQNRPIPSPDHSANPKADLANWCGQVGLVAPVYHATREGPDHKPYYSVVAMLMGVVVGQGAGTRKTTAEVDAASNAMRNLALWVECLGMEGEKFFRVNSEVTMPFEQERTTLVTLEGITKRKVGPGDDDAVQKLSELINIHSNAFTNTNGGLILVGVDKSGIVAGERLTREDVDALLVLFDLLTKDWLPTPDRRMFKWRVFPVFTKAEIDDGSMVKTMEKIFSQRDPRGMVWPPDRRVVLGLNVVKSPSLHEIPLIQVPENEQQQLQHGARVAYVHTQGGVRLLRPEELRRQ